MANQILQIIKERYAVAKAVIARSGKGNNVYVDDIGYLITEVEKLQNELALYKVGKRNLESMVEHKNDEITKLRKALEYYADAEKYEDSIVTTYGYTAPIVYDEGETAREALK